MRKFFESIANFFSSAVESAGECLIAMLEGGETVFGGICAGIYIVVVVWAVFIVGPYLLGLVAAGTIVSAVISIISGNGLGMDGTGVFVLILGLVLCPQGFLCGAIIFYVICHALTGILKAVGYDITSEPDDEEDETPTLEEGIIDKILSQDIGNASFTGDNY